MLSSRLLFCNISFDSNIYWSWSSTAYQLLYSLSTPWWRHQMETFSALPALCEHKESINLYGFQLALLLQRINWPVCMYIYIAFIFLYLLMFSMTIPAMKLKLMEIDTASYWYILLNQVYLYRICLPTL